MDYKKYSLENLEKWMSDALLSSEATPKEIYDIIRGVVHEEYHYFKHQTGRCYELLALLGGTNNLQEQVKAQGEVWDKEDDGMRPWGHSDLEYMIANPTLTEDRISNFPGEQYSEEELNAMCDKAASNDEKEKCREYNLREAEYYNQRAQLDAEFDKIRAADGYDWTPLPQKDKVVKWQLPVEIDGVSGEYYVQFPDDLMEVAGIKENDMVEWIDRKDGSFELRKVNGIK
jgi:hypothetical protein